MNKNIILCGVGGQGTVLASRLLATAAIGLGLPVLSAETIGMAQRGGSVISHIRIGDEARSPMIAKGTADLIIGFEPGEAVRQLDFLKASGAVVVSSRPVMPVSALTGGAPYKPDAMLRYLEEYGCRLTVVDAVLAAKELGSDKTLNVVLLGAAAKSGELGFGEEDLERAVRERVPERYQELNLRALSWFT